MTTGRWRCQQIFFMCHSGQNQVTYPCHHQSLAKRKWDLQNGFRPSGTGSLFLSTLLPNSWTKIRALLARKRLLLGRQPVISSTIRIFLFLHYSCHLKPNITRKRKWSPRNLALVISSNILSHIHPPYIHNAIKHQRCVYLGVSSLCTSALPQKLRK